MNAGSPPTIRPTPPTDRMLRYITEGRVSKVYDLVDSLVDADWSPQQIVVELLGSVQRQLGEQWQTGRVTIAREHAVTAVVDDVLGALGRRVPLSSGRATVALVCAEGEWHVTPARMAALLLRFDGWRITFFGGSTPGEHLARSLELANPSFVAVSCTDARFLLGAARVGALARGLEVPSIAGGAAFGKTPRRAERLGLDGWAPDVATASSVLERWLDRPPPGHVPPAGPGPELRALARRWSSITEQAIQRLANVVPPVLHYADQPIDAVRRDLEELLHMAHLAARCDDPSLLGDFVRWLARVHPARGLPHAALPASLTILADLTAPFGERLEVILRRAA